MASIDLRFSNCNFALPAAVLLAALSVLVTGQSLRAANQTATVSPVLLDSQLPYKLTLKPYDFGAAELPTLHSYAAGEHDGKWVLIAGRTNGLHGFEQVANNNFPPQFQNRDVWVIDPVTKQSWSRSLDDVSADLSTAEINSLAPANNQFYQRGDRLYMTGGYGPSLDLGGGNVLNSTFDVLSAIDLPGMVGWVQGGPGTAKQHIRQLADPTFQVTGGAMYEMGGTTHLVVGQNFQGNYTPNTNGIYTNQVRSFDIVDDGVTLSIANATASTPNPSYRRRDLNVVPVIRPDGVGGLEEGLTVLSGVFTPTFGAWTVPVEVDESGVPTMADPTAAGTFKQSMNGYHSAKVGLFSESTGEMHQLLFGGISLQYYDANTGQIATDNALPFVNDVTSIVIDAGGEYSQHRIGEYPVINDNAGRRLRFGANAEFFLAEGIEAFANGVLKLDSLGGETTVGYIFGGLTANGPHTRNVPGVTSLASNTIFEVIITPVPEPAGWALAMGSAAAVAAASRRRRPNLALRPN